ncbi:AsnC family transcriptional regulator [Aliisedimentitalea scapharcae]|uniref:siroheme decarboxylase n=1 Tax=Aliisedimentitalea scapharcae TaxID=1524259 RepID=A0ABZ2XN78_9RHOB
MHHVTDPIDQTLLNDWQRDFPLVDRPFATLGRAVDITEDEVITRLSRMRKSGRITRVGATITPGTVSASTLAAVATPPEQIEEIAALIDAEPGVNHNYLREDHWNLWFVATGPDTDHVEATLARIERRTGLKVMDLRLVRPFNVDLGFCMRGDTRVVPKPRTADTSVMQPGDKQVLQVLTRGLPITSEPFAEIAAQLNRDVTEVMHRIDILTRAAIISRLGVIVRHRALGWSANAMVVWNLSPDQIDLAGPALAAHPGVSLCYERRPVEGHWPYRLYSMIHARSRSEALATLQNATTLPELADVEHKVLFSTRCFKQTGAMITQREVAA